MRITPEEISSYQKLLNDFAEYLLEAPAQVLRQREELECLLKSFQELECYLPENMMIRELPAYQSFLSDLDQLIIADKCRIKQDAPSYNLFEILNIQRYETRVHTPYLVHLLKPNESHGQGRLFIDAFMTSIFKENFDVEKVSRIWVDSEKRKIKHLSIDGQADIFIRYHYDGREKVLLIENKIDHTDGERQLERYYYSLCHSCGYAPEDIFMVYLTTNGRSPSAKSISPELYKQLKATRAITEYSYRHNLCKMLDSTLQDIQAGRVKETLIQYISLIQTI